MSYSNFLPAVSITALTALETAVGLPMLPDIMDVSKRNAITVGTSLETTFAKPEQDEMIVQQVERASFSDMLAGELRGLHGSSGGAGAPAANADAQAVQAEATADSVDAAQGSSGSASDPAPETAPEAPPEMVENADSLLERASRGTGFSSGATGPALLQPTEFASLTPETLRVGDSLFEPGGAGAGSSITPANPAPPAIPGPPSTVPVVSLPMPFFLLLGALACLMLVRARRGLAY
ncbi:MAG: hypothetical protein AAGC86_12145 [Pseudomonadota bacterium]